MPRSSAATLRVRWPLGTWQQGVGAEEVPAQAQGESLPHTAPTWDQTTKTPSLSPQPSLTPQ